MAEFILEILSEEIPARMQPLARNNIATLFTKFFNENKISFNEMQAYTTPRRLVLHVADIALKQQSVNIEKRGPKLGAPDAAINGFLAANNLASKDELEVRNIKGSDYYFFSKTEEEQNTKDIIAKEIVNILSKFPWQKSMRFLPFEQTKWVRPIRNICCTLNEEVVDFTFAGAKSNNLSYGHRFMSPESFTVTSFADYERNLFEAMVILNQDTRKASINKAVNELAQSFNISLHQDDALLEEITGLVEWPTAILGNINEEFMGIAPEVLITALREHQKYFSLFDNAGNLAPNFITVSNMVCEDMDIIRGGNERVLNARLYDAKFFWDQDRKTSLESNVVKLKSMAFQNGLGSQFDRSKRLESLSAAVAKIIAADEQATKRAALLCKADLVSNMVFEFPEVQGIMGGHYARLDNEDSKVHQAISEHYLPSGQNDAMPSTLEGVALSIADKMDTIVGFWSIGKKPTGSGDPFALRRSALSIIKLLKSIDNKDSIRLFVKQAIASWRDSNIISKLTDKDWQALEFDILQFFAERIRFALKADGFDSNLTQALVTESQIDSNYFSPTFIWQKANALKLFLHSDDGKNILLGYKRASNILQNAGILNELHIDESILVEQAEIELFKEIKAAKTKVQQSLQEQNYEQALATMAELRNTIDAFFENIMVNVDDERLKTNRYALLLELKSLFILFVDFSLLT